MDLIESQVCVIAVSFFLISLLWRLRDKLPLSNKESRRTWGWQWRRYQRLPRASRISTSKERLINTASLWNEFRYIRQNESLPIAGEENVSAVSRLSSGLISDVRSGTRATTQKLSDHENLALQRWLVKLNLPILENPSNFNQKVG